MRLEFLEDGSPDCPLIRIYGTVPGEFAALHREVLRLASGAATQLSLNRLTGFVGVNGCELTMISSSRDIGVRRSKDASTFEWLLTPAMWDIASDFTGTFARDLNVGRYNWLAGRQSYFGIDVGKIAVLLSASEHGEW